MTLDTSGSTLPIPGAPALSRIRLRVHGINLHVVQSGSPDGSPVVLLHGFPEFWFGWRHQIAPLANAGFRLLVPDQRGYGLSDKPAGIEAYKLDTLAADIVGLLDALEIPAAHIVGHDWGGIVAWQTAQRHSDRVRKLITVNAPHPYAIRGYALRHPGQFLRSAYAAFFQIPAFPEALLRACRFWWLRNALTRTSRPGTFDSQAIAFYQQAWAQPGALTAMLNWYRALRRFQPIEGQIRAPALVIWGKHDPFLQAGLARASLQRCSNGRILLFEREGHWFQHERPGEVNAAITQFLA
jgi:pimeloyl-ACP methyl ester carboxylesterase